MADIVLYLSSEYPKSSLIDDCKTTKEFNGQIRCMSTLHRAEREGFGVPDINGRNVQIIRIVGTVYVVLTLA